MEKLHIEYIIYIAYWAIFPIAKMFSTFFWIIVIAFIESLHLFWLNVLKSSAADLLYVGKGWTLMPLFVKCSVLGYGQLLTELVHTYIRVRWLKYDNWSHPRKNNECNMFVLSNKQWVRQHLRYVLVNPFPHTTILRQTTLNVFCQKMENLHNWMDNLWLKVENIVAKGEIARFV